MTQNESMEKTREVIKSIFNDIDIANRGESGWGMNVSDKKKEALSIALKCMERLGEVEKENFMLRTGGSERKFTGAVIEGKNLRIKVLEKELFDIKNTMGCSEAGVFIPADEYAELKKERDELRGEQIEMSEEFARQVRVEQKKCIKLQAEKDHLKGIKFVPHMQSWEDLTAERDKLLGACEKTVARLNQLIIPNMLEATILEDLEGAMGKSHEKQ